MNSEQKSDFIEAFKSFLQNFLKKDFENIDKTKFKENIESIKKDINLDKIKDLIKKIEGKHDVVKHPLSLSENEFDRNSVENCLNYLVVEDDEDEDNEGKIDLTNQTNNTIIILYCYYLFKNKKINLTKSAQLKEILRYFTIKNMSMGFGYKEIQKKLKEIENEQSHDKKVDNII